MQLKSRVNKWWILYSSRSCNGNIWTVNFHTSDKLFISHAPAEACKMSMHSNYINIKHYLCFAMSRTILNLSTYLLWCQSLIDMRSIMHSMIFYTFLWRSFIHLFNLSNCVLLFVCNVSCCSSKTPNDKLAIIFISFDPKTKSYKNNKKKFKLKFAYTEFHKSSALKKLSPQWFNPAAGATTKNKR